MAPRVDLPVQDIGLHGDNLNNISFTAADATNDHSFVNTGKELLLMKITTGTGSASVAGVADPYGRATDITITPNAGTGSGLCVAGPFQPMLFGQPTDSMKVFVNLTVATNISFAVVKFNI